MTNIKMYKRFNKPQMKWKKVMDHWLKILIAMPDGSCWMPQRRLPMTLRGDPVFKYIKGHFWGVVLPCNKTTKNFSGKSLCLHYWLYGNYFVEKYASFYSFSGCTKLSIVCQ